MFIQRLLSGIVLVILMLVTIITGNEVLLVTTFLLSLIGVFEFLRVFKLEKKLPGLFAYAATAGLYVLLYLERMDLLVFMIVTFFLLLMSVYVLTYPKFNSEATFAAFTAFIYVALLLSYIYQLRMAPDGKFLVWLIVIASWGSDTCAYCTGMLCKRFLKTHKMAPVLSPKKSIEGFVGGLVGAGILGLVYGIIFADKMTVLGSSPALMCMILCIVCGAISVIGDLAASAIKRNHDIKDYGKLIPGHGGVLDRFDSILFAAPVAFYVAELFRYIAR